MSVMVFLNKVLVRFFFVSVCTCLCMYVCMVGNMYVTGHVWMSEDNL